MIDTKYLSLMTALLVVAPTAAFANYVSVPEPSSMALLAVGVAGAAFAKFRKRK